MVDKTIFYCDFLCRSFITVWSCLFWFIQHPICFSPTMSHALLRGSNKGSKKSYQLKYSIFPSHRHRSPNNKQPNGTMFHTLSLVFVVGWIINQTHHGEAVFKNPGLSTLHSCHNHYVPFRGKDVHGLMLIRRRVPL